MKISPESISAYEVLDSRGNPTVAVEFRQDDIRELAMVPSGASTGSREAKELRDADGIHVKETVANVSEIAQEIAGLDITHQDQIDQVMKELDGTPNKSRLGANAILGVSLVVAKAAAAQEKLPPYLYIAEMFGERYPTLLPTPMMNVINGGKHANNGLVLQEFMIIPTGARTFSEALDIGASIYRVLRQNTGNVGVGDEGGFAPLFKGINFFDNVYQALNMLQNGVADARFVLGRDISFAIDAAASEFYEGNHKYRPGIISHQENSVYSIASLATCYGKLLTDYPVISLEDGVAEDDDIGWKLLTMSHGNRVQLVGDDVFVSNPDIFKRVGIEKKIANAILVKLNQIGTLTETLQVIKMAREANYNVVISHRSGETEDTFIADLAVGVRAGQIKTGAPARGERTAKYNRLLAIVRELGSKAEYAGDTPFLRFRSANF